MSYYNEEGKTGSHVKMSLKPNSDTHYYLTNDSVDFKFTGNQGIEPAQFVPAHSLLTIDDYSGDVAVYGGIKCNYKIPIASIKVNTWDPVVQDSSWYLNNIDEVKSVATEISKEQYERLCPMFEESGLSYYTPSDAYSKYLSECDKVIKQNTPKMQYYLTDRDIRLHYFDGDDERRMYRQTELPKHTVVAVDAANKTADYVGYEVLKEWSEGTPDFVNLCDIKSMSHEINKEQYDMLFDLESRSQDCNIEYNKQMYECIASEMKGDTAEMQANADKLQALTDARHSVENVHAKKLESVLDGFGKSNVHLTDTFAGQINKYGVDIDFTKIHSVNVTVPSDIYVGGMDENGHEAKDNFRQEVDTISFQIDPDNGELCVCESEWGDCGRRISTWQALEKISDYLDTAAKDSNVSLYVKQNDGTSKPIAPILADAQTSKLVSGKMAKLAALANENENIIEATDDYSFG